MKHTIEIRYYAHEQPIVELREDLRDTVVLQFVDLMEQDFLILEHGGIRVYRTYKREYAGAVEEWADDWLAPDRWMDWENDAAFDSRELRPIPHQDRQRYKAVYPQSTLKQKLAYAIDQGWITEDGYDASESDDSAV